MILLLKRACWCIKLLTTKKDYQITKEEMDRVNSIYSQLRTYIREHE